MKYEMPAMSPFKGKVKLLKHKAIMIGDDEFREVTVSIKKDLEACDLVNSLEYVEFDKKKLHLTFGFKYDPE